MASVDFSSYLDVEADSISKTVPSLPAGTYFARIKKWEGKERFFNKEKPQQGTPVVELTFTLTGADEDVEGLVDGRLPMSVATKDYDLTGNGQTYLRNLAEDTLELDVKGFSLADLLDHMIGQECRVFNVPRPGKEEGVFYTNISKVLPA